MTDTLDRAPTAPAASPAPARPVRHPARAAFGAELRRGIAPGPPPPWPSPSPCR
ncbi:hypothetical protein ABMX48_03225 [Streptomyces cavourensis]